MEEYSERRDNVLTVELLSFLRGHELADAAASREQKQAPMSAISMAACALTLAAMAIAIATAPTAMAEGPTEPPAEATTAPSGNPRLLLNKCCRLHERLDALQRHCEAFENATQEEREFDHTHEDWSTLRERGRPWWMEQKFWKTLNKSRDMDQVRYDRRLCDHELTAVKWTREALLYYNGSLKVKLWNSIASPKKSTLLLNPEDYCMDQTRVEGSTHTVFLTCPCARAPCVRKCCDYGKMLTVHPSVAMSRKVDCDLRFTSSLNLTLYEDAPERLPADATYSLLRGPFPPACASGRKNVAIDSSDNETDWVLLSNGSMSAKLSGSPFLPEEYCVDRAASPVGEDRLWVMVCAKVAPPKPMGPLDKVYVALYSVGIAALLATLVVYALLPSLRRPVNAKALMCHAAALVIAMLALCVSRFVRQVRIYAYCASLALVAQFFLLAAFCWLSVLCFDIARGFSTTLRPASSSGAACRRLLLYSLFAWGVPAVIVSVSAFFNFAEDLPFEVLRPDIGRHGCWIQKGYALFAYYYGPVAVLLVMNVGMFSFTVMRLQAAQREMSQLKNDDGQLSGGALRRRRERVLLYAKLFSLMGVTWLLEVVARLVGADKFTFFAIDTINVLRGVGVFVACCCKREVLHELRERLCFGEKPPQGRGRGLSYTTTLTTSLGSSTSEAVRMRRLASIDCNHEGGSHS